MVRSKIQNSFPVDTTSRISTILNRGSKPWMNSINTKVSLKSKKLKASRPTAIKIAKETWIFRKALCQAKKNWNFQTANSSCTCRKRDRSRSLSCLIASSLSPIPQTNWINVRGKRKSQTVTQAPSSARLESTNDGQASQKSRVKVFYSASTTAIQCRTSMKNKNRVSLK